MKYDIAAYIWPAYTGREPRSRIFWNEGFGEWQTVKAAKAKFEGHKWPRHPLWGYVDEADPYVMEMEIEAAVDYGVNVFIYDWYWYDNRPFLEQCLDDGFLKAKNNKKMNFYIMWANHPASDLWDKRNSDNNTIIWETKVDFEQFKIIGRRWLDKYLKLDNYYKIEGKPVISIYELSEFINGLGGIENAKSAIAWLNAEAVKEGLAGIHFQYVKCNDEIPNISGVDGGNKSIPATEVDGLGFESVTHYQFVHFLDVNKGHEDLKKEMLSEWDKIDKSFKIPYFPHVSVGWDNNPRHNSFKSDIAVENEPKNFEKLLRLAKDYVNRHNIHPLITINSWNEWTESSYLQPDDIYGYGYLEAVKKVFKEE